MANYYVLGLRPDPQRAWVLTTDGPLTLSKAVRRRNWQGGNRDEWCIAIRTGPDTFVAFDDAARTFTADIGPYTQEHWAQFLAEWKA